MSGKNDVLWCDPASIEFKISPFLDLPAVKGGDWDIERRQPFADTAKCRAIFARYVDGVEWIETDLFASVYKRRLERNGRIGRARTLEVLAADYARRFDKLYASMKRDGFRTASKSGKQLTLPALLMGRGGEVFIGNQGNHRLAMAQVLGLEKIAGRVVCRHELWTR